MVGGGEARGGTELGGALLLGAFHLEAELGLVSEEEVVPVGAGVGAFGYATEAVEVQLTLEGG